MDKGKSIITEVEGDNEISLSLPPGYRFVPSDTELVVHYLYNKVYHKPLPGNMIIAINIYDFHPQQLARKHPLPRGEIHWYFFTQRERKHQNGVRPNRATSDGYWKAKGPNKPITYENKIVGYKMSLDYYEGRRPDGIKTEWKMYEYTIHKMNSPPTRNSNAADPMKLDDWVLCKIYSLSKNAKDVQENPRTELVAENANQDSRPFGPSNGKNMETPSFSYLLPPNSERDRFLSKPLQAHRMPLVGPSKSFQEIGVQISNPFLISSGDNDLMHLDGIINGSSHDNTPSSLGAHTMHIEEQSSPNSLPHNSKRHHFMLELVDDHTSPLAYPSMSFPALSGVQIPNPSLLSSGDNHQLMNDLMYWEGVLNDSSYDNCPSSVVPI